MKFFIDAQLPRSLVELFKKKKIEALHVEDLPNGNKTSDSEIVKYCDSNQYILITKDFDFLDSFLLRKNPTKLLIITTGNIKNRELLMLFDQFLSIIVEEFNHENWIEISNEGLIIHSDK
ncbi:MULTISPECIES: DUF5615 family PIN-like protein [Leptospira]|uniref:DUF5615 family PIN-like protein n=1 Tax=Leptospira TaxID=171 RepID=UPI00109148EE|nr:MULTISPECIES: DUF5615 family PIN-like protein [Leptospira]MCG6142661.1 DUF5615 family PIN-like protein [Leptospira mtsangambouensis]TGL25284.1 toxin PIN [Leptospira bourretii]